MTQLDADPAPQPRPTTSYMAHVEAADDACYQLHVSMMAMKQEINELRDATLNKAELVALLDAYNKAGR
jgi:hypothetical protein